MEPDFGLPDGGLGLQPSVRATLEASLALLPDAASRLAFEGLGILPTSVKVGTHVLARLWRLQMDPGDAAGALSAGRVGGGAGRLMERADVDRHVSQLVRAGLLHREVDVVSGVVDGVVVHPVVWKFAKSLLGDSNCQLLHGRLVRDYVNEVNDGGADEHGSRVYPYWKTRDDGYWFDHVAYHAAACGDVSALVPLMRRSWRRARVRTGSALAYQADVEVVLASLLACVDDGDHEVQRTPALLTKVYRALSVAYRDRAAGNRAVNTEAAVVFCKRALKVSTRDAAPLEWALTQHYLGNALRDHVGGDRAANVDAAVACYARALEVRTRDAAPLEWASTQCYLGRVYRERVSGDRATNVEAAIACFERVLKVFTREETPLEWAAAQCKMGSAIFDRVGGDKAANVEAAIACYERALGVRTRAAAPLEWARTQCDLGTAYSERVGGDAAANVAAAIACYERALEVQTRDAAPLEWARTAFHLSLRLSDAARWSAALATARAVHESGLVGVAAVESEERLERLVAFLETKVAEQR